MSSRNRRNRGPPAPATTGFANSSFDDDADALQLADEDGQGQAQAEHSQFFDPSAPVQYGPPHPNAFPPFSDNPKTRADTFYDAGAQCQATPVQRRMRFDEEIRWLVQAVVNYEQALLVYTQINDFEGQAKCFCSIGESKMRTAYLHARLQQYQHIFVEFYQKAVVSVKRALFISDEKLSQALNALESSDSSAAESNAQAEVYRSLSTAISMVLEEHERVTRLLEDEHKKASEHLARMIGERDQIKAKIGPERWKQMSGGSGATLKRLELQQKVAELDELLNNIATMSGDIDHLRENQQRFRQRRQHA